MKNKTVIFFVLIFLIMVIFIPAKHSAMAASDEIIEVQTRLKDWGYYDGPINGVLDSETTDAIYYFQSVNGLRQTGQLDGATASAIGQQHFYFSCRRRYNYVGPAAFGTFSCLLL